MSTMFFYRVKEIADRLIQRRAEIWVFAIRCACKICCQFPSKDPMIAQTRREMQKERWEKQERVQIRTVPSSQNDRILTTWRGMGDVGTSTGEEYGCPESTKAATADRSDADEDVVDSERRSERHDSLFHREIRYRSCMIHILTTSTRNSSRWLAI